MKTRKATDAMKRKRKRLMMDPVIECFKAIEIGRSIRWHAMRESIMGMDSEPLNAESFVFDDEWLVACETLYGRPITEEIAARTQIPESRLFGYDKAKPGTDKTVTIDWSEKPADLIIKDINEGLEQAWHNASGEPIQGGIMDALNGVFDDDDEDD